MSDAAALAPAGFEPARCALVETFPDLARVPRVRLTDLPTPLEPLRLPGFAEGLWVKRDDLTSPVYGGNKPRKLEWILGDALAKGAGSLLTSGYLGTNHGLATLLHARRVGLPTRIILVRQAVTDHVKRNLLLLRHHGAEMVYAPNMVAGAIRTVLELRRMRAEGRAPYFVPPGGSSTLGTLGFVQAAFELRDQINQGLMPVPDCIYVAHGSSGSLVGLALGCRLAGIQAEVMGVRVVARYWTNLLTARSLFGRTRQALIDLSDGVPDVGWRNMHSINGYFGPGYGVFSEEARAACALAEKGEARLHLDPGYTSKTLAAMLDHARREPWKRFLFWNTYNSMPVDEAEALAAGPGALPPAFQRIYG